MEPKKDRGKDFDSIYQEFYDPEKKAQRRIERQREQRITNKREETGL